MRIGALELTKTAMLAPMAGVADQAFRTLCRAYGACMTVSEMASAKGIGYGAKKSRELLEITEPERPMSIQLFGDDPLTVAKAAEVAMAENPDAIDLNMGCPAPKIAGNGGGAALMKNPVLAGEIVRAVVAAVPVPVTVKFRKGWDEETVNAVEFAKRMEASGASALTVHGRTRAQMYQPPVDLGIIRAVKLAVQVPVIGNGDVTSAAHAARMYEATGCDLVMVGRGALGAPWVFYEIREYLLTGIIPDSPPLPERMAVMRRHIEAICRHKGDYVGMREARKHVAWYLKGMPGAAAMRKRAGELSSLEELDGLIEDVLGQPHLPYHTGQAAHPDSHKA